MSNLPINYRNFELNKARIKAFADDVSQPVKLDFVEETKLLFFDHNVTGKEYNSLIRQLQQAFIAINNANVKTKKEFLTIYDTFESLDKEYIQSILASTASANEAAQQADAASKEALKACEKADKAREKTNITINALNNIAQKHQQKFEAITLSIRQQDANIQGVSAFVSSETQKQIELREKMISDIEVYRTQIDTQNKTIAEMSNFVRSNIEQQKKLSKKMTSDIEAYKTQIAAQNETIADLTNKIKYAYIVSAIAISIACAHFFIK